jgi:hypothetical protein
MSGPEDQHPWDREDEEIRQAFAEKDAEIARIKKLNVDLFNDLRESQFKVGDRDAEIARLKQFNLMTDEQVVMDLKAEIEQLKQKIKEQEEYIAKLKRNAKGITGQ